MPTATINPKNVNATASVLSRISEKIPDLTEYELAYLAGVTDGLAYSDMPQHDRNIETARATTDNRQL